MNDMSSTPGSAAATAHRAFPALRDRGFKIHLTTYLLAMMADNIEHVISYWMLYQKFHSPALAGFAVLSHWLPFLMFSVAAGALADRFDPRRIIQCGMGLFSLASLGWGYFFITGTLQVWHAMVLLVIHGCAGVLWQTPNQLLLYDIVAQRRPHERGAAQRDSALCRGAPVGPAMGGLIMLTLGPSGGILLNTVFYLPLVLWLINAPYGPRFRKGALRAASRQQAALPTSSTLIRDIAEHPDHHLDDLARRPLIILFVGNAYSAQMPGFAQDLGHGDPGVSYSMLLAADAAGAMLAGFVLEGRGWLPPNPRTAIILAMLWCGALTAFAFAPSYPVALAFLFAAGFCELSFNAMAQTLVQVHAPATMRGRVIWLVQHGEPGTACSSARRLGRPRREPDRHSLVPGALRAGDARCCLGVAGPAVDESATVRRYLPLPPAPPCCARGEPHAKPLHRNACPCPRRRCACGIRRAPGHQGCGTVELRQARQRHEAERGAQQPAQRPVVLLDPGLFERGQHLSAQRVHQLHQSRHRDRHQDDQAGVRLLQKANPDKTPISAAIDQFVRDAKKIDVKESEVFDPWEQ